MHKHIKLYYLQFFLRDGCQLLRAVVGGLLSLCSLPFLGGGEWLPTTELEITQLWEAIQL